MKNLNELKINEIGYISKIDTNCLIKKRLLDLGFIENTKIIPILKSPSGDPRAFNIRNTTIAIRKEDCDKIFLK